jgi:hypothetical protein
MYAVRCAKFRAGVRNIDAAGPYMVQFHRHPEDTHHGYQAATLQPAVFRSLGFARRAAPGHHVPGLGTEDLTFMNNRRLAIIAGLGVVELWIVGLMIRSLGGDGREPDLPRPPVPSYAGAAAQDAARGRVAKTVETGAAPHVVIDDDEAALSISVRPGTTVEVFEERRISGWFHGALQPLSIVKTNDGVSITQPGGGLAVTFGSIRRRLDVVVPPAARIDVRAAASVTAAGLRADATLHSDDGSILVSDQRGAVRLKTDNGRIELRDVDAPAVDVGSDNGRIVFDRVRADRVAVVTDDGRIDISRSLLRGGKIRTDSGRIRLGLDSHSNVTVTARASSGKIVAEPPLTVANGNGDSDAPASIRVGNGMGRLEVGSDDGSITVLAGGG